MRPGGGQEIPRVLHRVWLGDAPLPLSAVRAERSWREHHPDWDIHLWTDEDLPDLPGFDRARNIAERADLARYEILRRHGGVYADVDVTCLRPFDDLLRGVRVFAGYEVPGRLCNAVIGAVPDHPALGAVAELSRVTVGHGTYPEATATSFLTHVFRAYGDVTLFGPEVFYPELWNGQKTGEVADAYTAHEWIKSWDSAGVLETPQPTEA